MRPHLLIASVALTFPAAAAVAAPPAMTDVVLARSALAAIDADATLRGVNLIVSVVDRAAVVGGPVPSVEVGKRAAEVVRSIGGISQVTNDCFVQEKPDPLVRAVADRLAAGPRPLAAELPAVATQSAPKTEAPARPTDTAFAALAPPPPALPTAAPVVPADKVVVASRPPILSAAATDGFLGVPGSSGRPAVLTGGSAPLVAPAAAAFPARPSDALASADAIRKADARYSGLTAELRDGTVVVGGKAANLSDAWDFAQSLRRVPGVARVVVGGVGVK